MWRVFILVFRLFKQKKTQKRREILMNHKKDVLINIKNDMKAIIYDIDEYRIAFRNNFDANQYFDIVQDQCYSMIDLIMKTISKFEHDIPRGNFINIINTSEKIGKMLDKIFEFQKDEFFVDLYA